MVILSALHAEGPQFEPRQCQFILNTGYITVCKKSLEAPGIDPSTSGMLRERSTFWATPPVVYHIGLFEFRKENILFVEFN